MIEENNNIFLAGGDAPLCLVEPMHKKYSTFVWGHPFSMFDFSTPLPLYVPVHILDDPTFIPPVAYVLNGWPISQPKNK